MVEVKPNMVRVELYPSKALLLHLNRYANAADF